MPTNRRRRKEDQGISPFMDPAFRRSSIYFDDIEYQRRFEQNLIRYDLKGGTQITKEINNAVVVAGGGGGNGHVDCYWTLEGSNIVRYGGNVGVGVHPHDNDFEVRGNVLVEAKEEQPYVEIRNWSDTAYDPVIHWSLGATPVKKFTMGVDDSDSDAWLLCAGAYLSKTLAYEYYTQARTFGSLIVVTERTGVDRIHSILRTPFSSHVNVIGTTGSGNDQFTEPASVCSDGVYVYVADQANDRVVKRLASDLSYVSKSSGEAPNLLLNPVSIITDGTYLYVSSTYTGMFHIYKLLCSDLSFVSFFDRTDDFGNNGVIHMATDGVRLYIEANGGNTWRMCRVSCATMTLIERYYDNNSETNIASYTMTGAFLDNGSFYLIGLAGSDKRIFKFNASNMAYVSKSSNMFGTGVGQLQVSGEMDTDGTFIYVTQAEVSPGYNRVVQFLLSDYSYVTAWGTYGNGNDNLGGPIGLCCVSSYSQAVYTPANYPILAAANDGSYCDAYPLLRARDGFQLMEDGTVAATKYVGLYAPAAITASYSLTFPGTGPAAVGHFAVSAAGAITFGQNVGTTGSPTFVRLTSLSVAIGTAPITVTSTTVCTNLNAGMVDGYHHNQSLLTTDGPSFDHVHLTVAIGTAPLVVTSTTMVANLNADLLDGNHASAFAVMPSADPGVDSILFWDESSGGSGAMAWLTPGNSVAITGTVLDTIQDIRTTANPTWNIINATAQYNWNSERILIKIGTEFNENLIIGSPAALASRTSGILNFGFGYRNLVSITSGSQNIAIGSYALNAMATGGANVAIGNGVLQKSTGSNNNGVGDLTLSNIVAGQDNNAFGDAALRYYTTGNFNSAFGGSVLWNLLTGSNNTAFGFKAGYAATALTGSVFYGYKAGYYETESNKLFIDNAPRASEADARVKALIYGIFAAATGNQYLYVNANLSVPHPITSTLAIGTAPLAVTSTTVCGNLNADLWDGYQFADYLDQAVKTGSGPTFNHAHVGSLHLSADVLSQTTADGSDDGILYLAGGGGISVDRGAFIAVGGNESGAAYYGSVFFICGRGDGGSNKGQFYCRTYDDYVANNNSLWLNNNGNFGIGTKTRAPLALLQVGSQEYNEQVVGNTPVVRVLGAVQSQVSQTLLRIGRLLSGSLYYSAFVDFNVLAYQAGGSPFNPATQLNIALKSTEDWPDTANVTVMTLRADGKVGINDTAPAEALDVTGNINVTGVYKVDDVQVLKEQQAAIADLNAAYAAGDLDTEAEIITALNTTNAKMNTVLAMLRTHGAIAT